MTDTAPSEWQDPNVIRSALSKKRIAVVGMSSKECRASYLVGNYLKYQGYTVIPVNPLETEILGLKSYSSLKDVPGSIDIVNVFRASSFVPQIAEESVKVGAKYLWLQLEVISAEGVSIATQGGLQCIVDRCLKIEHAKYMI
tara:strand:- start:251 stop:676 length:426 start_codon:yes stop_codon:yes gene_type:complete